MARLAKARDRKEASFLDHLEELRQRLIRCVIYIVLGMAAAWFVKGQLMEVVQAPLKRAAEQAGVTYTLIIPELAGGLIVSIQVAAVAGIILTSPLWLLEAWLFIEPALEDHERKWVVPLLPAAVFLFLAGVAFCYWLSPRAFAILLGFQLRMIGQEAAPILELRNYLTFFLRLLLIFGAMFELPLVTMFLSAVGIVKSEFLAKHWRIAVVVIAVVGAIVTPTPDAVTLSFLLGPMFALYALSVFLARLVEKGRREQGRGAAKEPTAAPTPAPAEPEPDPYAVYRADEAPEPESPEDDAPPGDTEDEV
jgi:sec-independent protein translocase protein TatC